MKNALQTMEWMTPGANLNAYIQGTATVPSLSFEEDKALLEDLLAAAVNDAVRRVESQAKTAMSDMTGGMNFPPGFKMPF